MTDNLFNTPTEEVNRLVTELRDTRDALREVSSKLTRIETRLKRVFPQSFPKRLGNAKKVKPISEKEPSSLTSENAMALYEDLVQLARRDQMDEVLRRLSSLNVPDLSFLRKELGASMGKKRPSSKVLIDAILGRVKESVMLSKHSNRQDLINQESVPEETNKEGGNK